MNRLRLPLLLLLLVTMVSAAIGQTFRGTVAGIVIDAQGAVVPNASVVLKNPATDAVINGKSNGAGEFNFPELGPRPLTR